MSTRKENDGTISFPIFRQAKSSFKERVNWNKKISQVFFLFFFGGVGGAFWGKEKNTDTCGLEKTKES